MGIISKVKSGASHAKTTISHVAEKATPSIAKPVLHKIESEVKEHPMVASALVGGVPAVLAVGAYQHKDEIKSTLQHVGHEVKKDAGIVKHDTIAVTKKVGTGIEKVGKTAVSGFKNHYFYGMLALGGVILIKFL